MAWSFETVAGPFKGALGGLAWDGAGMLFTAIAEEKLLRYSPESGKVEELRKYTNGTSAIAVARDGVIYGCQGLSRRVIRCLPDGTAATTQTTLDGKYHNQPADLAIDRAGRIWFADAHGEQLASGPQIFPYLDHASVLRLDRNARGAWTIRRLTYDTAAPRAHLLSADEATLFVSENHRLPGGARELRAYPVRDDDTLGQATVLLTFGADHRGSQRGIEGMCLDDAGNIVACAGAKRAGPGPTVYVISPSGLVLEGHALPADLPTKCAFGDRDLASLYVATGDGVLLRAGNTGRRGRMSAG